MAREEVVKRGALLLVALINGGLVVVRFRRWSRRGLLARAPLYGAKLPPLPYRLIASVVPLAVEELRDPVDAFLDDVEDELEGEGDEGEVLS